EVRLTRERGAQAWPTWQPLPGQPSEGQGGQSSGGFKLGKPILNKRRGTAKLPVTIPVAGTLSLRGHGVKPIGAKVVSHGGTVRLIVNPRKKLASALARNSRARVKVTVSYVRRSGGGEIKSKAIALRKLH